MKTIQSDPGDEVEHIHNNGFIIPLVYDDPLLPFLSDYAKKVMNLGIPKDYFNTKPYLSTPGNEFEKL